MVPVARLLPYIEKKKLSAAVLPLTTAITGHNPQRVIELCKELSGLKAEKKKVEDEKESLKKSKEELEKKVDDLENLKTKNDEMAKVMAELLE